jgi:ChrB, C-terminal domain
VGHPRPPQDRPDRLPLADPPLHRPPRRDPLRARRPGPPGRRGRASTLLRRPPRQFTHRNGNCTFEVLIDHFDLGGDPTLARLARIVHAADLPGELDSDPLGPGLLAIGEGGLEVEADDQRLLKRGSFVYDALYAWCQQQTRQPSP